MSKRSSKLLELRLEIVLSLLHQEQSITKLSHRYKVKY